MNEMSDIVRFLISVFLMSTVYFIPMGIALLRKHNHTLSITLINFLLGWTIIFWIVPLLWSMSSNVQETRSLNEILRSLQLNRKANK
jgi:hypothetical protein